MNHFLLDTTSQIKFVPFPARRHVLYINSLAKCKQ